MAFQPVPVENGKFKLMFSDEPAYVHALDMAPEAREPELNVGTWLIVAFPVWSSPVRQAVREAIACVKEQGGKFQLGVRPFDSYHEFSGWWPDSGPQIGGQGTMTVLDGPARREIRLSADHTRLPLWLVLKDGQVVRQEAGPRSKAELKELMGS